MKHRNCPIGHVCSFYWTWGVTGTSVFAPIISDTSKEAMIMSEKRESLDVTFWNSWFSLKRKMFKKVKLKKDGCYCRCLTYAKNISLLFVELCHAGIQWLRITHWISRAMFLKKIHAINHCLIQTENANLCGTTSQLRALASFTHLFFIKTSLFISYRQAIYS